MQERRRHNRYRIEGEILISHREGASDVSITQNAVIKDISLGGTCINIFTGVPYPLTLDVTLQIPLSGGTATFEGTVIRVIEVVEDEQFDLGIQFSYISDHDMKRLQDYMEYLSDLEDQGS